MSKQFSLVCFALALPVVASADIELQVTKPDLKAPLMSWTPLQQWSPWDRDSSSRSEYGYGNQAANLLFADELGDKLSELGRASVVDLCFRESQYSAEAKSTLNWALCGPDAKALDLKKLEGELTHRDF